MSKSFMMLITDPIKKTDQWYQFSCKIMKTKKGNFLFRDTVLVEGCVPSGYYCEKPVCDKTPMEMPKLTGFDPWTKGDSHAPDGWTKPSKLRKKGKVNPINLIH